MGKKLKREQKKFREKEMERLRRIIKVVDNYYYKEVGAEECMERIAKIVYES